MWIFGLVGSGLLLAIDEGLVEVSRLVEVVGPHLQARVEVVGLLLVLYDKLIAFIAFVVELILE